MDMEARSAKPRIVHPMPRPDPVDRHDQRLRRRDQCVDQPREPCSPRSNVGSVAIRCIPSRSVPALNPWSLPDDQHDRHVRVFGRREQRLGRGVVQRLVEALTRPAGRGSLRTRSSSATAMS